MNVRAIDCLRNMFRSSEKQRHARENQWYCRKRVRSSRRAEDIQFGNMERIVKEMITEKNE